MERFQRSLVGFFLLARCSCGIQLSQDDPRPHLKRQARMRGSFENSTELAHGLSNMTYQPLTSRKVALNLTEKKDDQRPHLKSAAARMRGTFENSTELVHGLSNMTYPSLTFRRVALNLTEKSHLLQSSSNIVFVIMTVFLVCGFFMVGGIFDDSGTTFVGGGTRAEKGYSQMRPQGPKLIKAPQGSGAKKAAPKESNPPRTPPGASKGGPPPSTHENLGAETIPFQQPNTKISSGSSEAGQGVFNPPPNNLSMTFGVPSLASGRSTPVGGYPAPDYLPSSSNASPVVIRPDSLCPDLILPVESSYSISFEGVDSGRGPVPIYGRGEKILLTANVLKAESVTLTMGESANGSVLGSIRVVQGALVLSDKNGGHYGDMRSAGGLAYMLSSSNVSGNADVMKLDFDEHTGKAHFVSFHDGSRIASAARIAGESSSQEDRLGILVVAGVDPVLVILCIIGAMALS